MDGGEFALFSSKKHKVKKRKASPPPPSRQITTKISEKDETINTLRLEKELGASSAAAGAAVEDDIEETFEGLGVCKWLVRVLE